MTPEKPNHENYPDPAGELEEGEAKKTAAEKAKTQPEAASAEAKNTEPASVEAQLANAYNTKEAQDAIAKIEAYGKNPENIGAISKPICYLDTTLPMRKFRTWWDNRSRLMQWAIMKACTPPMFQLQNAGPIQTLIKFGLITYKGHYNENPQKLQQQIDSEMERKVDDKIDDMGILEKYLLKYGVKLGKYVYPELAAVEPFVEPLMRVKDVQTNVLRNIRHNVRRHRLKYESTQVQPADVAVSTEVQANDVVDQAEASAPAQTEKPSVPAAVKQPAPAENQPAAPAAEVTSLESRRKTIDELSDNQRKAA